VPTGFEVGSDVSTDYYSPDALDVLTNNGSGVESWLVQADRVTEGFFSDGRVSTLLVVFIL
jgi:hypothetical protein